MIFEFATATRVIFGSGTIRSAAEVVAGFGARRVLVVTGRDSARHRLELDAEVSFFAVAGEPTLDVARAGVAAALAHGAEAVIAIGGGGALDAGKAIAALVTNGGDPLDYIEVIGRGRALVRESLPFIAIPTTAGTGSEVTKNAVLTSPEARVKASMRSPLMLPRVAIVDPDLLATAPATVLAYSGLDALSQLIEPYISSRATALTDTLAEEGIRRSARSLGRAVLGAKDAEAREDLALASMFGGMCLANAGLGAVHGFAAPAGGMYSAPHGAVCAALLAPSIAVNLEALRSRAPEHRALPRLARIARLLTGDEAASADGAVGWLEELRAALSIPGLEAYGMREPDLPELVAKAKNASSMRGNPIALEDGELFEIARRALK